MATATGERARRAARAALALLVLAAGSASAAEVTLGAVVDQAEISQDEQVTLEVRLETPEPPTRWEFPTTPDFELKHQLSSQEHTVSLGGGAGVQIHQVYVVTRQLQPTRTGALTIPSVKAVVRGREYVTQPIVVKVRAPGSTPAPGPAPGGGATFRGWEKDLSVEVEVDRKEVHVGEQLTATYWLLTRGELVRCETTPPRFAGFWKEDLQVPEPYRAEDRKGPIPTHAYLIGRVALFPTRAGDLTIDPLTVAVALQIGSGGFFDRYETARRSTAPVTIHVKPLPPGAPAGFEKVNVGTLALNASVSSTQVAVGDPVAVQISVAGDGNVRALSPPHLPPFPGARAFPPTVHDRTDDRGRRLMGVRTVETVLVPERDGEMVIAPVDWTYFDPATRQYRTARTPELTVTVLPAGAASAAAPPAPGSNALITRIRPIRADLELSRRGPPPWQHAWFLALLLAPPFGFLSLVIAGRLRRRDGAARAQREASRGARRRISAARRRLARGDAAPALAELERALLGYASDRLGRPAAGLTRDELSSALARAGAHPPAVRALLQALDLVDASRYGGGDAHGEEVLLAAERAVTSLEEADWQPDREVGT